MRRRSSRRIAATAMLCLLATLTVFAQSAGTQPPTQNAGGQPSTQNSQAQPSTKNSQAQPSTQNIEELKQKLAELEKEVQTLRQSVKQLEEQQKRATQEASQAASKQSSSKQPPSTQPAGAAGTQGSSRRQRPISGIAKQETVSRDRETVARIDNQPLDPELVGFFNIPGTKDKLKIDGYAKLDVMMDPRPAGDPDEFISYYTSGNLILRPLKHYQFTVGAEFLYGWQLLKDNSIGRANRIQVSLQYNLYKKPDSQTSQ